MLTHVTKDLCNKYQMFKFINMFFHLLPPFPLRVSSPIQEIGTNQFLISLRFGWKQKIRTVQFHLFFPKSPVTLMKSEITPEKPIYKAICRAYKFHLQLPSLKLTFSALKKMVVGT